MGKRIKVPAFLKIIEQMKRFSMELHSLHGVEKFDLGTGTKWRYDKEKGWQYLGSMADMVRSTPSHYEVPDASDDEEEKASVLETKVDQLLTSSHRVEQDQQVIKAMLTKEFNYTMLSTDNRVLKIGWAKPSAKSDKSKDAADIKADVIESLKKRYGRKNKEGDSFRYIDIQEGNYQHEQDTHAFLAREGVPVLYRDEYYSSHEAIEALRKWRVWCLGEFSAVGGILPPISDTPPEAEQGELSL